MKQAVIQLAVGVHFALEDRHFDRFPLLLVIALGQTAQFGLEAPFAAQGGLIGLLVALRCAGRFRGNAAIKIRDLRLQGDNGRIIVRKYRPLLSQFRCQFGALLPQATDGRRIGGSHAGERITELGLGGNPFLARFGERGADIGNVGRHKRLRTGPAVGIGLRRDCDDPFAHPIVDQLPLRDLKILPQRLETRFQIFAGIGCRSKPAVDAYLLKLLPPQIGELCR